MMPDIGDILISNVNVIYGVVIVFKIHEFNSRSIVRTIDAAGVHSRFHYFDDFSKVNMDLY
jgi:hypothetical protein